MPRRGQSPRRLCFVPGTATPLPPGLMKSWAWQDFFASVFESKGFISKYSGIRTYGKIALPRSRFGNSGELSGAIRVFKERWKMAVVRHQRRDIEVRLWRRADFDPGTQVDSIVADGRLEVCDGAHRIFVMKKVKGPALRFAIGRATGPTLAVK